MSDKINQKIKGNHNQQFNADNMTFSSSNISTSLSVLLPRMAIILLNEDQVDDNDTSPYRPEDKIIYNNVLAFKPIIDEYGTYSTQIDILYEQFEDEQPLFKKKIFKYFRTKYILKKQMLMINNKPLTEIEIIRNNSDEILRSVFEEFKTDLLKANNLTIMVEDLDYCALALTCHAFFNCKILEKPPQVK